MNNKNNNNNKNIIIIRARRIFPSNLLLSIPISLSLDRSINPKSKYQIWVPHKQLIYFIYILTTSRLCPGLTVGVFSSTPSVQTLKA